MEGPGIFALPVTGAGVMAASAAVSGQLILALVMAALCAMVTGILVLRYDPDEGEL